MAKTLKDFLNTKNPLLKSKADQEFYKKNVSAKVTKLDKATENDDQFKANNVKTWKRAPLHGVDGEEDTVSDGTNLNEISKDLATRYLDKLSGKMKAYNKTSNKFNKAKTDAEYERLGGDKEHTRITDKLIKHQVKGVNVAREKMAGRAKVPFSGQSNKAYDTVKKSLKEEIDEGLKLHKTYEQGNKCAKVYRDAEWDEYRVKHFINGKHHKKADYHTNDKDDAHSTAKYWLKEDTLNEIKVGDHIHAGLGTKGGAGFKGVVTKVEGNTVHFRQHEKYAKGNKFGPRQFKAPKSLVTVEKKNLSESTKKEALKRYHKASKDRLDCIKGLLKKFHDNQLKSSYHDLWSTKDIHRRIEDLHDDLVGRTDIPNVKSTLHENQLDEISKKTLTSYIRKSMNDRDWKRSERLDIARNSMNPSIYRERDDYKKVAREGGNRSRGIDRALDRLEGNMKYGKTSHQEKISYGKGRPPKNAPKEKTVTKFKTKEYTAKE